MIPLLDLVAQHSVLKRELMPAIADVIESGNFVLGEPVKLFEEEFADFCGTKEAVALNTGTSALHLALLAAGVGPGDEVVTVSMTFVATTAAIIYSGAKPVFVDIDPHTWTMDPGQVERAITARTKAIVPVHLHGRLADMDSILNIAQKRGLIVIEDAAQAHGACRNGKSAGSMGDIGCFSFYPGKNLGACGEGGAAVTNRAEFAEKIRLLRDWGQAGKYNHVLHGFNYRMDALQAAVLRIKLRHLRRWTELRRNAAARYEALLKPLGIVHPAPADVDHVYHVYAISTLARETLRTGLASAGIATGIHYPKPVHLQQAYADLGFAHGALPVTERLSSRTLSLPIFPEITQDQIQEVVSAISTLTEERTRAA